MSTWMVVEDEPDIYDVLLAMFQIWGIEGVAFVDGAEAVSWIEDVDQGRVRGALPELAILDIRLPEVSGPDVGKRLRASQHLRNIAIVLITAYRLSPEEEKQVVAHAQADLLMYKPLPAMPELREKMAEVIGKRKSAAQPGAKSDGQPAAAPPPKSGANGQPQRSGPVRQTPRDAQVGTPRPTDPKPTDSED